MLGGKSKQTEYKILCTVAYKIVLFCIHRYIPLCIYNVLEVIDKMGNDFSLG